MRKTATLMLGLALSAAAAAQDGHQHRLTGVVGVRDVYFPDTIAVGYDAQGRMECYRRVLQGDDPVIYNDSLQYDTHGNPVAVYTHQLLHGGWILPTFVHYTYDDAGRRLTRTNYTDLGGGPEMQATYTYEYDAQGRPSSHMVHWADGVPFEMCQHTYDAQGRLSESLYQNNYWFWGDPEWENVSRTAYHYDDAGRLARVDGYDWDIQLLQWFLFSHSEYDYDAEGNCVEHRTYAGSMESTRRVYEYDPDIAAADVYFPPHPEEGAFPLVPCVRQPVLYHSYMADVDGVLQYVGDYLISYEALATPVPGQPAAPAVAVFPNPARGTVTVAGDAVSRVEVYSLDGRRVLSADIAGQATLDLAPLAPGRYVLRAYDGQWSATKLRVE